MITRFYRRAVFSTGLLLMVIGVVPLALASDDVIYNSCKKDLKLTNSGCQCVVSKANETLNENQMTFFLAAIQNNQSQLVASQSKLTGDEMLAVTEFMTATPSACQNQ